MNNNDQADELRAELDVSRDVVELVEGWRKRALEAEAELARAASERDEARAEAARCPNPLCGWVPQTYGEAVMHGWIKGHECINYDWDNRTTAENAKWLIELYRSERDAALAQLNALNLPPQP